MPDDATPYFNRATSSGAQIPTGGAFAQSQAEYLNLAGSSGDDIYKNTRDYITRLGQKLSTGTLTPAEYQKELRDLGARMNATADKKINEVEYGSLGRIKDRLEESLDDAAQRLGPASDLAQARKLYLKGRVFDDLQKATFKADKTLKGQGEQVQFNAAEVLRKIEQDDKFSKRFQAAYDPKEQEQIKDIYRLLNRFPNLPPALGVNAGSLKAINDLRTGLVTGGAAHMIGLPSSITVPIAVAGTMARPVMETAKVFGLIMQTHEGRQMLLNELRNAEGRPMQEILQKVAVAALSTKPVQDSIRELDPPDYSTTTIQPFENVR
jgi:hypothetical protein